MTQLQGSIEKLLQYIAVHVKEDTAVEVYDGVKKIYEADYRAPEHIIVSPTLYTRVDACHGAGNCCRVPFDLVYTGYDRQRVVEYDEQAHAESIKAYGEESASKFLEHREMLLDSLVEYVAVISTPSRSWRTSLWVQQNTEENPLSGVKSCNHLFMGKDRYYCGVHPFKPLHCWYPHMVVRCNKYKGRRPTVVIGRMQYGRNYAFGCPVLFEKSAQESSEALFEAGDDGPSYFERQFDDDLFTLDWTSKAAVSMGFNEVESFAVGLGESLRECRDRISHQLSSGENGSLILWSY
jgi:Fe-S-cluster containining protein